MMGRSHALIGVASGLAAAHLCGANPLVGAMVGGISGLAPDLDHPNATLGRRLPRWWHAITPGHRGPTHALVWVAGWGMVLWVAWEALWRLGAHTGTPQWAPGPQIAVCGFLGALSHVLADGLTVEGVPLLWPYSTQQVGVVGFATGSWVERVATVAGVTVLLWLAAWSLPVAAIAAGVSVFPWARHPLGKRASGGRRRKRRAGFGLLRP